MTGLLVSGIFDAIKYLFQLKGAVDNAGLNKEHCRWIDDLLPTLVAIAKGLEVESGNELMRGAAEGLEKARQHAAELIAKCQKKGLLRRAWEAKDIAEKLQWTCNNLLLNLNATSASMLVGLRADVASNTSRLDTQSSMLAMIMKRLGVHPDPQDLRSSSWSHLWINPYHVLWFGQLLPNKDKIIRPVTLFNKLDYYVGVCIAPTNKQFTCPHRMIISPHSALAVPVTMWPHEQRTRDTDKFNIRLILAQSRNDLAGFLDGNSDIMAQAKKKQSPVYREHSLKAITCEPPSSCQIATSRSTKKTVTCACMHRSKTWVVIGHKDGSVCIWDYQKMKLMAHRQVSAKYGVCSVTFIAQKKWLVVGAGHGRIYFYHYDDADAHISLKNKFIAEDSKPVNVLAAHPTEMYVVSSSKGYNKVNLWNWKDGWIMDKEITVTSDEGVQGLKFTVIGYFRVDLVNSAELYSIKGPSNKKFTTLDAPFRDRCCYFTSDSQRYMVSCEKNVVVVRTVSKSKTVHTGHQYVYTLNVEGRKTMKVVCHPNHPILATALDDGTICLWDARTTWLKKMFHVTDSGVPLDLCFYPDRNGLTRLLVNSSSKTSVVEVDMQMENTGGRS